MMIDLSEKGNNDDVGVSQSDKDDMDDSSSQVTSPKESEKRNSPLKRKSNGGKKYNQLVEMRKSMQRIEKVIEGGSKAFKNKKPSPPLYVIATHQRCDDAFELASIRHLKSATIKKQTSDDGSKNLNGKDLKHKVASQYQRNKYVGLDSLQVDAENK